MRRYMPMPTLKNYVARYKMDKKLLEKYPEQSKERELLERRYIRVKDNGWGKTIDEIGNPMENKWFNIREFFSEGE